MSEPEDGAASQEPALPMPPRRRRVRCPTVLQMEAVECGAAALGIILAYHGRVVPLEELRVECGVSRDGSRANNIMKAARKYGLVAKGFKCRDLEPLYDLPLPVVLFWNMNHFLVLEGFGRKKAYLNDPAQGPRAITIDELNGSFSGVVIAFEPGPDFQKGGHAPSMAGSLWMRLRESKLAVLYVTLCGLLLVTPGLVLPTFTRIFVDDYLIGNREFIVQPLLLAMAITAGVVVVLVWLQRYYLLRLETMLSLLHSSRFFAHIQRLPVPYFVQRFAGDIAARVDINDHVATVIASKLTTTAIDLCVVVFYAALMFVYDATLTFTVIGVSALNIAALQVVARMRDGRQPALVARSRQAHGHGHRRPADDRDAEGHRRRGRVLLAVGRLPGEVADLRTDAVADLRDDLGGSGLRRLGRDDCRLRRRRPGGHDEPDDGGHAPRLPDARRELHAPAGQPRVVRRHAAGTPGRHEPARRTCCATRRTRSTRERRPSRRRPTPPPR